MSIPGGSPFFRTPSGGSSSGATGGSGAKNYLTTYLSNPGNGDFELNLTTGWGLGTVTLTSGLPTGVPTFGSGASGNLAFTTTGTGKLAGSYSGQLASSAATTAGNFLASDAFTIDLEDRAKALTVKGYYSPTVNPTNGNWSGTSSNSFGWAIYDVTNSAWIIPAGGFSFTQSTGVGLFTGTFQTSSNGVSYRLVIYNATATAGAITVLFDDLSVSPQTAPIGFVGTDPVLRTVTGSWVSNTTYTCYESRDGNRAIYDILVATSAAPTSTQLTVNLPSGRVIDTSVMTQTANSVLGQVKSVAAVNGFEGIVQYNSTTSVTATFNQTLSGTNPVNIQDGFITQAVPGTFGSGNYVRLMFSVPIVGWSSNVQMSNDTDTRVVDFVGSQTTQAVTANVTNLTLTTVKDSHGAWNGTQYVVPVAGDYIIGGSAVASGTASSVAYKNGVSVQNITTIASGVAGGGSLLIPNCVPGDLLSVRFGTSVTITAGYFYFQRLSGPSVIAATESVNGRYTGSSTTISGSLATIVWTTKARDTHNAMVLATGLLTIPISGMYLFNVNVQVTGTIALNSQLDLQLQQNSVAASEFQTYAGGAMTAQNGQISDEIPCLAGDVIRVQLLSSAVTPALSAGGTKVFFSWARVGN